MKSTVFRQSVGLLGRLLGLLVAATAIGLPSVLFFTGVSRGDDGAMLAGNHPAEAESLRQLGEASPDLRLQMQIHFALHNKKALERLLAEQQNPASANYHKWLSTDEFLKRFGPSKAELNAVAAWLASEGFTVTRSSGTRWSSAAPWRKRSAPLR